MAGSTSRGRPSPLPANISASDTTSKKNRFHRAGSCRPEAFFLPKIFAVPEIITTFAMYYSRKIKKKNMDIFTDKQKSDNIFGDLVEIPYLCR